MIKKIAFMFLILDNPNFYKIWDRWFKNVDKNKYNIYIHSKYVENLKWRPDKLIDKIVPTAWGHIVNAELCLLKYAFNHDKNNYKFIILSESCVPIKSFDALYSEITKNNNSYIKTMKMNNYDKQERILNFIEKVKNNKNIEIPNVSKMIKHYSRYCLNRDHVKKLINTKQEKINFYIEMPISDEFWLSLLVPLKNYTNFEITFDDWDYVKEELKKINNLIKESYEIQETTGKSMKKEINELTSLKQNVGKNPKTIIDVNQDLEKIKNCKSFFYRKFGKESNIEKYIDEILND
jgi:hypothetical protein